MVGLKAQSCSALFYFTFRETKGNIYLFIPGPLFTHI